MRGKGSGERVGGGGGEEKGAGGRGGEEGGGKREGEKGARVGGGLEGMFSCFHSKGRWMNTMQPLYVP
jgi:hypothetical protein